MEISRPRFARYIFVCGNQKPNGEKCCGTDGIQLREAIKQRVRELGFNNRIRVSLSGCLDLCSEGPNVLLMPDNVWFQRVSKEDVPAIVDRAIQDLQGLG